MNAERLSREFDDHPELLVYFDIPTGLEGTYRHVETFRRNPVRAPFVHSIRYFEALSVGFRILTSQNVIRHAIYTRPIHAPPDTHVPSSDYEFAGMAIFHHVDPDSLIAEVGVFVFKEYQVSFTRLDQWPRAKPGAGSYAAHSRRDSRRGSNLTPAAADAWNTSLFGPRLRIRIAQSRLELSYT